MPTIAQSGYTEEQAIALLTGPNHRWSYRADLYDSAGKYIRPIDTFIAESGDVTNDTTRAVIRSARIYMHEPLTYVFDQYSHRIALYACLYNPDGPVLEYPLGRFCVTGFNESITSVGRKRYQLDLGDFGWLLSFSMLSDFAVKAGDSYGTKLAALLAQVGIANYGIGFMTVNAAADKVWEMNNSRATVEKDIVGIIPAVSYFDETGRYVAVRYTDWAYVAPSYIYTPDRKSVIYRDRTFTDNGINTPNYVKGTLKRIDVGLTFSAVAQNTNINSPFSIPRRGLTIPEYITLVDAYDAPSFQQQVDKELAKLTHASIVGSLRTAMMPFHGPVDVVGIRTEHEALTYGAFQTSTDNWTAVNCTGKTYDGFVRYTRSGVATLTKAADVALNQISFDGRLYRWLKVVLRIVGQRLDNMQVWYTTAQHGSFDDDYSIITSVIGDYQWREYLIDMWQAPLWATEPITSIRIAPVQDTEYFDIASVKIWKNYNRFKQQRFSMTIEAVPRMSHTVELISSTS